MKVQNLVKEIKNYQQIQQQTENIDQPQPHHNIDNVDMNEGSMTSNRSFPVNPNGS